MIENELSREKAASIQLWASRYAQHRTLAIVVGMILALGLAGGLATFGRWARQALEQHRWLTAVGSLSLFLGTIGLLIWITLPQLGGHAVRHIGEGFYRNEGRLLFDPPPDRRYRNRLIAVAVAFFLCVQGTVELGFWIPVGLLQPVSSIYVVPFLIFIARMSGYRIGLMHYVWPALYVLHALLVLAGAPIVFSGTWEPMNILLPVGGYGLLTALAGYVYSRYALRRLREAAR